MPVELTPYQESLKAVVEEIAAHMPGFDFDFDPAARPTECARFKDAKTGRGFLLSLAGEENERVVVHGLFKAAMYVEVSPWITTAVERGGSAIASTIRGRFLPKYNEAYEEALTLLLQVEGNLQGDREIAETLAESCGAIMRGDTASAIFPDLDGSFTVDGGTVSIELADLPPVIAAQVLALVA